MVEYLGEILALTSLRMTSSMSCLLAEMFRRKHRGKREVVMSREKSIEIIASEMSKLVLEEGWEWCIKNKPSLVQDLRERAAVVIDRLVSSEIDSQNLNRQLDLRIKDALIRGV